MINVPPSVETLKSAADRFMAAGNPRAAIPQFEQATSLAPARIDLWLGLAACRRAIGDLDGALAALHGALLSDPRCFPALLMQGAVLEAKGESKAAAVVYKNAIDVAPPEEHLGPPLRKALEDARARWTAFADEMAAVLRAGAHLPEAPQSRTEKRINAFVDVLAGRRKVYASEPIGFHYPGLPAIEFFERDAFPWIETFEARTDAVRRELLSVWAEGSPELVPYIDYPDDMPLDQWAELNHNLDWSAYHLIADGAPVAAHAAVCPETIAAAGLLDQPHIPRRSPSAMFSILKAGAHIPAHNGVANTRLVVHLPLVIPEGCWFRVGGETRHWRVGEAWVFDDTIDHEAWNRSAAPRAILICDTWNPLVPPDERDAIIAVMTAFDAFHADIT